MNLNIFTFRVQDPWIKKPTAPRLDRNEPHTARRAGMPRSSCMGSKDIEKAQSKMWPSTWAMKHSNHHHGNDPYNVCDPLLDCNIS